MNKSRGRPRGNPATKPRIAEVARELFLRHGYQGTTLRAVAAAAGVDSALIGYHFGAKHGLFSESMRVRRLPSDGLTEVLRGDPADPADLASRMLRSVTEMWEDPRVGGPLAALVSASLHDEQVRRAYRGYLEREVIGRIAEYLGGPDASERAAAAAAVIGGLILTRYLMPLSPLADLTPTQLHHAFHAPLRAALTTPRAGRVGHPSR